MILKGSTTSSISHAGRLANHLLSERDNDHLQVLEIAGQQTDDPKQAMLFMHGAVTLTRGKKGLFQVSINPEEGEVMTHEQWDDAVVRVEKEFGLIGQPRIIVEHIKEGRQHRHIVWQRTNYETEKLVPINDYKTRLVKQAREMERDYGHRIVNDQTIGPKFDQAAHRQAKRLQKKDDQALDPKNRSAFIRQAWERSENADDFVKALKDGGLELAQGNKARMVLLHSETGEIIKGSLGRHLKCPDKGIVRAAELREWANGLSAPLQDVEATQERLKAQDRQEPRTQGLDDRDAEIWDREKNEVRQQNELLDAAHEAAQHVVDTIAEKGKGEIRQPDPQVRESVNLRQEFMDAGHEYKAAIDEWDAKEKAKENAAKAAKGKQLKPEFKQESTRTEPEGYQSVAEELDRQQALTEVPHRRRLEQEEKTRSYYRIEEQEKLLAEEEARLGKMGVFGRFSGKRKEQQGKIDALRKTLEDARRRQAESLQHISSQYETEIAQAAANQNSSPSPEHEKTPETEEEYDARMLREMNKRREGPDRDIGPAL